MATTANITTAVATILHHTTVDNSWNFRLVDDANKRSDLTIGIIAIIFIVIILAILFGNIIVIIAILTYRQLKKQQSNLFILNLAFADLSVVITVMIWTTIAFILDMGRDQLNPWIFTTGMCYFQCAMNYCLIVVSMMTLGFISIDRFVHIVYPLRYHDLITVRRIRIMILWTWIQGLVIGFIPVGMQWIHYDYCEVVCAIDWSSEHADKFVIVAFITCFLAPAFTMLICYSVIFKRSMAYTSEIRKSSRMSQSLERSVKASTKQPYDNIGSLKKKSNKKQRYGVLESSLKNSTETGNGTLKSSGDTNNGTLKSSKDSNGTLKSSKEANGKMRRHNKIVKESTIVKSLLVVVLVFFVCMTPFSTTKLIKVLKGYIPCWVNTLATIIQLLSSACNPLIYGIFRKEYRKAFKIQYNKACHRMQARFTSSDYSDSFSSPYYADKPPTLKRKGLAKNMSVSSIEKSSSHGESREASMDTINRSTNQLYPHNEKQEGSKGDPHAENEPIGPLVVDPQKKYSLPHRTVSFSDSPESVNQSTEIIAL